MTDKRLGGVGPVVVVQGVAGRVGSVLRWYGHKTVVTAGVPSCCRRKALMWVGATESSLEKCRRVMCCHSVFYFLSLCDKK